MESGGPRVRRAGCRACRFRGLSVPRTVRTHHGTGTPDPPGGLESPPNRQAGKPALHPPTSVGTAAARPCGGLIRDTGPAPPRSDPPTCQPIDRGGPSTGRRCHPFTDPPAQSLALDAKGRRARRSRRPTQAHGSSHPIFGRAVFITNTTKLITVTPRSQRTVPISVVYPNLLLMNVLRDSDYLVKKLLLFQPPPCMTCTGWCYRRLFIHGPQEAAQR